MKFKHFKSNKFYISRDGSMRRKGSYSVGYSEALEKGLIPDNKTSRKKYKELLDRIEPIEWHHGLGGNKVNFFKIEDLNNNLENTMKCEKNI